MIRAFWAAWGLRIVAGVAVALTGYAGVLRVELAVERAVVARLNEDLIAAQAAEQTCAARLSNIQEARASDATVDECRLGDFDLPPLWRLPEAP